MTIRNVFIANRSEIALRIIRTCERLGIETAVPYTRPEKNFPHTRRATRAVEINSYLDAAGLISAAKLLGAEALHPGYGYLSESAAFARAVERAGLVFLGPSPESMALLGAKDRARALAAELGIPIAEGYNGEEQSDAALAGAALRIGFPLLIKAAAGGGGRGMRLVRSVEEFSAALPGARREAGGAFGNETLLLERFIENARHIEVQVIGDGRGGAIHLFERECSVQRRYQKVIEEAPAPALPLREQITRSALALAREARLRSAATFEFLVSRSAACQVPYVFLEANTRIQVEHPVTEAVTGLDLVALQIALANGVPLPPQETIRLCGHAIEARIYAEIPEQGFKPSVGRIRALVLPEGVRIEHALTRDMEISTQFDPMLAKLIASGRSRAEALEKLRRAVLEFWPAGIATNRRYLSRILADERFQAGCVTTTFLAELVPEVGGISAEDAAARWLAVEGNEAGGPISAPYFRLTRRNGEVPIYQPARDLIIRDLQLGSERRISARLERVSGEAAFVGIGRRSIQVKRGNTMRAGDFLDIEGWGFSVERGKSESDTFLINGGEGDIRAHLPGTITKVFVSVGEFVEAGRELFALESMKMEHVVYAKRNGTVSEILVGTGQTVMDGTVVIVIRGEVTQTSSE